jgi:hypothetical protein
MIEKLHSCDFSEHLHTDFKVQLEGENFLVLKLIEVVDHKSPPGVEQFSLFFRGPSQLGQGLRTVEHEKLGSLHLFLVPVGADEEGVRYEAAFARYRE